MFTYFHNNYLYTLVEMQRQSLEPLRQMADKNKDFFKEYFSGNKYGRSVAASFELFERVTRDYQKPEFGITETQIDGKKVRIKQETVVEKTFCKLLHFKKDGNFNLPKMLVVAPMSGHYSTLCRGTVEGLLPYFDVYITDWSNARDISPEDGLFRFNDFVWYLIEFIHKLGQGLNILAVCQPSVPVSAAVAIMSAENDPCVPNSMILMGGPIDTRHNPTEVNDYAAERTIRWFESNVITKVPMNYNGAGRSVYPGFMQLYGFMAMNLQAHVTAHWELFNHLVEGDGDSADSHKKFYNEYLSVMDLPSEFYLETVNLVFKKHLLPRGKLVCDGKEVKLEAIKKTALLCIEGERDDISGRGQTRAAINLCKGIPDNRKEYHLQKGVGHYGIFNGKRYREQVVPYMIDFIKRTSKTKPEAKTAAHPVVKPAVKAAVKPAVVKKEVQTAKAANPAEKKVMPKKTIVKKADVKKVETKKVTVKKAPAKKPEANKTEKPKLVANAASPKVVPIVSGAKAPEKDGGKKK